MKWFLFLVVPVSYMDFRYGHLAAVVPVLPWMLAYWVSLVFWPYTRCGRCGGSGARRSPSGEYYGRCRKCKGSPEKLRWGNHAFRAGKVGG